LHDNYEYAYLLESMEGPRKLAQYSFIGFMPRLTVIAKNGQIILQDLQNDEKVSIKTRDPLEYIDLILKGNPNKSIRFLGGAVGYISYDAVRYWEKLPTIANDSEKFPDLHMGVYDDGIIFDHINKEKYYFYRDEDRSDEFLKLVKEPNGSEKLSYSTPKANITKDRYEKSVEKAKDYIESGDIFQVVLSKRYKFNIDGNLTKFYLALRKINPSPYMYYLKLGKQQIIGSSPEMLVRVDGSVVETFPIAGTCPRGDDQAKNEALAQELLADPKERAEHVMLVDLGRNDIGRVSEFGSVQVKEFMKIHQFSHVQHMVSRVEGKLREDCNCYDALRAVFPAGTVSGAPKVRAMEIIEECEPNRRGPYAGAVGYFGYNGNADLAITIRTLVADGDTCFIQTGGGIVADSIPEKEWFETEHKAKGLMKALEASEGRI